MKVAELKNVTVAAGDGTVDEIPYKTPPSVAAYAVFTIIPFNVTETAFSK